MRREKIFKNKAVLVLVSLIALLALITAGCAKPAPTPTPVPAPTAAKPAAAPTAAAPAPTAVPTAAKPAAPTQAATQYYFKYAEYSPAGGARPDALVWWVDEVAKRTNGRVKIEVYFGQALFKAADVLDAVGKGLGDMGILGAAYYPDKVPLAVMTGQPGLSGSIYAGTAAFQEIYNTFPPMQEELRKRGVELLNVQGVSNHHLISKNAIKTLADLKGKRMRALPGYDKVLQAAGAVPVAITAPEVYTAIEKGTVDGAHWGIDVFQRYKLYEVAKNVSFADMGGAFYMGSMINLDTWKKLPADIQKVFLDLQPEFLKKHAALYNDEEQNQIDFMKKQGVQFISLSPEDKAKLNAPAKGIQEEYAQELEKKGLPGNEFLKRYRELVTKYEKLEAGK